MTDDVKRGGYPGSGDGTTMGPPPPLPSGYFEAVPVPPDGYVPGEFREFTGAALEALPEAKVVALTKAVELYLEHYAANEPATMYQQVVDGARQLEAYLTGEPSKEADGG